MISKSLILFRVLLLLTITTTNRVTGTQSYGVDVSFPMQHHASVSNNGNLFGGDRESVYLEFMEGCAEKYNETICSRYEDHRIQMGLRQPKSMVNYTTLGFQKMKAPDRLWQTIQQFWDKKKENQKAEQWPVGSTYTNHWSSPTYLVDIFEESSSIRGGGEAFLRSILDETRGTVQDWSGQELENSGLYGIRVYTQGSILNPHVDVLPNVLSVVINVAQDVDQQWPFELIGHDGIAYNITMEPGEMIVYESHSILHGRPFAMQGRYYANLFAHFEPTGHSIKYHGYDVPEETKRNLKDRIRITKNHRKGQHEFEVSYSTNSPFLKLYSRSNNISLYLSLSLFF